MRRQDSQDLDDPTNDSSEVLEDGDPEESEEEVEEEEGAEEDSLEDDGGEEEDAWADDVDAAPVVKVKNFDRQPVRRQASPSVAPMITGEERARLAEALDVTPEGVDLLLAVTSRVSGFHANASDLSSAYLEEEASAAPEYFRRQAPKIRAVLNELTPEQRTQKENVVLAIAKAAIDSHPGKNYAEIVRAEYRRIYGNAAPAKPSQPASQRPVEPTTTRGGAAAPKKKEAGSVEPGALGFLIRRGLPPSQRAQAAEEIRSGIQRGGR